jgi:hypothetical protein
MSVRLSSDLFQKLVTEGSSAGMMPGESPDKWLARVKTDFQGKYNPPADMSLLADHEILEAVKSWVAKQSYNDFVTDKPIIQRRDSLILLPGTVSPYASRAQKEFRVKFPWFKFVPVMHFIHRLLVLRLVVDLGKEDRRVVLGHHIDPRRNKYWKHWAVGSCQYGFPTVSAYNGDSIYPRDLKIREVMRPILATYPVGHGGSDEVVWLANSDIGLVALDWQWWAWEEKNDYHWEVNYIPYGPLSTFRGETRVLKKENPYSVHNHYENGVLIVSSEGYNNPVTFEEAPAWMSRVYKEFYATTETSSNCLPHNPQWDVDVADSQIKNPVVHGVPVDNHQLAWNDLKRRYEKHNSAVMNKRAEWGPYWSMRYQERDKI